ncbi:hypothetical protein HDU93_004598, partial [Gonapodya sp. JEL0774]
MGAIETYLVWLIHGGTVGVALLYINNIGAILLSLQPSPVDQSNADLQRLQSLHVSIISIFNFAGRILVGFLVDLLTSGGLLPITDLLGGLRCLPETLAIFSTGTMLMGHILVWLVGRNGGSSGAATLWASSVLIGLANGSVHVTSPLVIAKFWGKENFGTNV